MRMLSVLFRKLQGCHIYEDCCELDLYFASDVICGCKPYIAWCILGYESPRAPLIPLQLRYED